MFTPVFCEAKKQGLAVTVHFAEAEASGSREELDTLLSWEPGRLGHVIWEDEDTKKEIAKRGLCLELCLSCNVKAGMVSGGFEGHHFGAWKGIKGPKISLAVRPVLFQSSGSVTTSEKQPELTYHRQMTWASLEVPCRMSIVWLPSTSTSIVTRFALWQGRPLTASLAARKKKQGCDVLCGLEDPWTARLMSYIIKMDETLCKTRQIGIFVSAIMYNATRLDP